MSRYNNTKKFKKPTGSIAEEAIGTDVGFNGGSFGREGLY